MPILRNCEIWFARLDPKRPNAKQNKENPTWEVQLRTSDRATKEQWAEHNLKVTPVRENGDEEGRILYWRTNVRKRSKKKDGTDAQPIKVKYGNGSEVDGTTIGNGSIGDIMIREYDYTFEGRKGSSASLEQIMLRKHIVYKPTAGDMEDFDEVETEVVENSEDESSEEQATDTADTSGTAGLTPPKNSEDKF